MFLVWKQQLFIAITSDEEDAQRLAAIHDGWYDKIHTNHQFMALITTLIAERQGKE